MRRFLFWFSGLFPCRFIKDGDLPYLERYYLGSLFGLTFYLHRFVASDPDRGLHDHPFRNAWSFILSGYYFEQRKTGVEIIKWFNRLTSESFHRVILPRDYILGHLMAMEKEEKMPKECWSLFIHTRRLPYKWGFLKPVQEGSKVSYFEPFNYGTANDAKKSPDDKWWEHTDIGRDRDRTPY